MYIYLIRHGQPIYSPVEQLTHLGHKQARALAPRLEKVGLTKIYSSPMRRARETAEPTANLLGLPIGIEPWSSEELAWSRFSRKYPDGHQGWCWVYDEYAEMVRGENHDVGDDWWKLFPECPNAKEGYAEMVASSDEFLARHGYVREGHAYRIENPNEDRIALFCHHGFSVTWLSHILRVSPSIIWPAFDISHTGVTVIHFANRNCGYTVPCLLTLSDLSHIAADDNVDFKYHSYLTI